MEFWGVEVKSGGSVKVQPGEGKIVHISQVCLGEVKKDKGNDYIRVNVLKNEQKFVIGILSPDRFPNLNLDLVFEDEFELSHDSKHGSVHFSGYKADGLTPVDEDESDDHEELVPIDDVFNNGKPEAKDLQPSGSKANAGVKTEKAEDKSKVKIVEPSKDAKKSVEYVNTDDEDDSDDDDDDSADDDEEEGEDMASSGSDEEDDSDEEEDRDEETPKKSEPAQKRPGESTSKTPVPEKKARFSTPEQKTDGRKVSGHVATPHPAKHTGKTPANVDKSNKQVPTKTFACSSCNKTFGSEQAVQSHSKAKHGGS